MVAVICGDIVSAEVDAIVNASNGIGYMGGVIGKHIKCSGVAESIHYATRGAVEIEARRACKRSKYLPRWICGYKKGDVFLTSAASLNAEYIIHAVTMGFPGMNTKIRVLSPLFDNIVSVARELKVKSIAIPMLGTGTGGLDKDIVLDMLVEYFKEVEDIQVLLYVSNEVGERK